MHPLEKKTLQIIQQEALLLEGETVIVGASGGPDSTALLHVLARLRPNLHLKVVAVYVDHGLRPAETGQEHALVLEQARLLGIECVSSSIPVREYAAEHGLSIEHAARLLRYEHLSQVASKYGASKIAVAHTADDQAEELLLRMIRGTGRKGLAGMAAMHSGKIIRPFLTIPKKTLLDYLADKKISFCEDSSNLERIYLRNRVRLDLIPYLEKYFNPNIQQTLRQTAMILKDEEALLERMAHELLGEAVVTEKENISQSPAEAPATVAILLEVLLSSPRAMQRRVVETVCWQMENSPAFRQIEQILDLAANGKAEAIVHLSQGLRVEKQSDRLLFTYPQGKTSLRGNLFESEKSHFEIVIQGVGTYPVPEIGKAISIEVMHELPPKNELKTKGVDYLDFDKFSFPLCLRSFLPGDRFHPLGAPGSKKVSDFLTDSKVPKSERWSIPVLADQKSIIALLGKRIDHRVRVTETTDKVVKVTVKPL